MKKIISQERVESCLKKCGMLLKQQRIIVLKQKQKDFAKTMSNFSSLQYSARRISEMEHGYSHTPVIYWFYVWLYMQNLDKIIRVCESDAKEMMYLAQQEDFPNILEEITQYYQNRQKQ